VYAGPIQRLISELSRLPGIGQRTAQRLAFHILRADEPEALALAEAIREVKAKVGLCEVCFNLSEGPRCGVCEDESRERSLICVVEEPSDVIPEDLRIAELVRRLDGGEVREVVLATNPTTTGEATALHIAELLRDRVAITRLASGLPVGADLEHADEVTLGRALAGRRALAG
jgi:recombination protein RecR